MRSRHSVPLLLALGAASCTPHATNPTGTGVDPTFSSDAYCQIAGTTGLYDWTGSAMVVCPVMAPGAGDEPIDGSACSASTIDASGNPQATSFLNVQGAQVLSDGRVLVWSFDGSLSIRSSDGTAPTMIADVAADPWVDLARNRVAYVAPAAGSTSLDPGADRRVIIYDIAGLTSLEVTADSTAASPVAIPGTDDVLYVSSAGDTAAVYRATATLGTTAEPMPDGCMDGREGDPSDPSSECTPPDTSSQFVQLTNTTPQIPQTIVPVFGRQHVFVGDGDMLRLVFAAPITTDTGALVSEIFTLDPRTGDAQDLGPGSYPQRGPQGSVLARTGDTTCTAVQYLAAGATP